MNFLKRDPRISEFFFIKSTFQRNIALINQFHATGLSIPLQNFRKPKVFSCFQGGKERDQWHEID